MFGCIQILISSLDLSFMKLVESGELLDLLNKGQIFKDSCYVVKGKAIPLQAWTAPKASRRLRLPDFKTVGT